MLAIVNALTLSGMEGHAVQVEVDVSNGLPGFDIVGLPATTVREAKERVRTAVKNSGFQLPSRRITVNLAPADLKKEGPGLDLAIAVGILTATDQISPDAIKNIFFLGELSLDGAIRSIPGVLPMACALSSLSEATLVLPDENSGEGALVEGITVLGASHLIQVAGFLNKAEQLEPGRRVRGVTKSEICAVDFRDIKGQLAVKRALEVGAAGNHNIILMGPPGTGKTMLARALPGIMPEMTFAEALDVSKIYSVAGLLTKNMPLMVERPFRAPHHGSTATSLTGGGKVPKPGEISLANHGVLFLDEMAEFGREVLEALRQPLEDRIVTLSRVAATLTYPARIMVVGSLNPCPCGLASDEGGRNCNCTPLQVMRYQARMSGPLLEQSGHALKLVS